MSKEFSFVEIDWHQSGRGDFACPDGEVESVVVSPAGVWVDPDSVKGFGVGDSKDKTVIVSDSGASPTPGEPFSPSVSTVIAEEPPLDLPQPPDMDKPSADIPYIFMPEVPLLEFSLTPKAVMPFSLLADQWPQSEVNIPLPPSDPDLNPALTASATEFIADYEAACREQKLFTSPFLVMGAVRFPDGTRVPGVPVLMIPNSETPTLTVESTGSSEQATGVRMRLRSRACQLKMRLLEVSSKDNHDNNRYKGCRVEILVAGPVSLRNAGPYQARAPHTVYARGYSVTDAGILAASDGGRLTGLSLGSVARDEIDSAISNLSEFRVIASVPYEKITDFSTPGPVPISDSIAPSTECESIKPDFSLLLRHLPEYATKVNSRMLLMGGDCLPPLPTQLRGATATGSHSGTLHEVTIEVELIKEGKQVRRRLTPDLAFGENSPFVMYDLENQFPRFIFYPDSDATLLRISSRSGGETRIRTLSLIRHEGLGGAYWFRGLAGDVPGYVIGNLRGEPTAEENSYPTPWLTSVSTVSYNEDDVWLFPSSGRVRCGDAHVAGATTAVRSLSSGQLGVFPLQLFTDSGIWAVAHDEASGGFHAVQPISLHKCINPGAIVPTPYGTVFCTLSGVMLLNGTQVKTLSDGCPSQFTPEYLSSCRIWYDAEREHIQLFRPETTRTEVYCLLTGKWLGYTDSRWTPGNGSSSLSGNIGDSEPMFPSDILPGSGGEWSGPTLEVEKWWQLTLRPLKMKRPHSRKGLRGLEVVGAGASEVRVRLWGASVSGEWHPLAEGSRELRSLFGSGWRLFRVSMLYRAAGRSAVEGLILRLK